MTETSVKQSWRVQQGFTLIELMVTLVVTMFGMVALLHLNLTMTRANQSNGHHLEGGTFAEEAMEEIRGLTSAELVAQYGSLPIDRDMGVVLGRNDQEFRRRLLAVQVMAAPTPLVRLRVEVSWTDDGAEPGADNGIHDHQIALELLRTEEGSQ